MPSVNLDNVADRFVLAIRYIHAGNSKFGAITMENLANGVQSTLKYRLFIDGEERWNTLVQAPPLPEGKKAGASLWDRFKLG
jgi:alkaline phosphatase D